MAYGVKYRAEWRATTRGERNYVVDILQNDYTGEILPLHLTGDCVTISYGEVDQSELQPIKSSEAEIHILCTEEGDTLAEFFTLDPAQYRVEIFEDDGLIWRGYIATGDYQQPLARPPYTVRLRANDGLGILESMPYLDADGEQWATTVPVSELLRRLLAPISDSIEIWGYNLITVLQSSPTFDLISIPDNAIYRVLGDEPTYYDVLEAVLSNFAVQLFQNNGVWYVRALSTLANAAMGSSPLIPTISLGSQVGSSFGIKADATMTFSPPLRKMTYQRDSEATANLASVVCNPKNWAIGNAYAGEYNNSVARYSRNAIAITSRDRESSATSIVSTATLELDAVIKRSASTKITFTADLFGGDTRGDVTYRIGVWLVNARGRTTDEVIHWKSRGDSGKTVSFPNAAFWWDDEKKVWQKLTATDSPTYSNLGLKEVTFEKVEAMGARRALSTLPKSSVTFDIPYIPQIESEVSGEFYEEWKVVIVVGSNTRTFSITGAYLPTSTLYIADPAISIAREESLSNGDGSIQISSDGTTDEACNVKWYSGAESNNAIGGFAPGVVDLSSDKPIYGYIEAGCGVAGNAIIGRMLSDMRRRTTHVIEGEVDRALPNGLNTIATVDGRYYYLTAYTSHLKRGVSSIQLHELPKLTDTLGQISAPTALGLSVMALGDALFWRAGKKIYFKRGPDGELSTIKTSTKNVAYRKGVGCVVVVEYDTDTASAEVYDDFGRRIAKIVFEDGIFTTLTITQWVDSIRYDATIQAWLAHDKYKVIEMYDSDGYVTAMWECPISDESITDTELLLYNGGFIYKMHSSTSGNYYTFWHCYAIHKVGEFEPLATWLYHNKNVVAINERFFVIKSSNGAHTVYHRASGDMKSGLLSSATSISSAYDIVAINEAMIITRDTSGLAVYDFRSTASSRWTYLSKYRVNDFIALCGDVIYTQNAQYANKYDWQRIFPKLGSLTNIISVSNEQL